MLLTAEFLTADSTVQAVSALRAESFSANDIELFSGQPLELPQGLLERPSHISVAAVLGALISGSLATAFIFFTQHNYPLVTGGMPLVSGWSTGVISFELIMAGAVTGVVLAFLWEGRLLRRKAAPPPVFKDGSVFLRIECPEESLPRAVRCLEVAGAQDIVEETETE